MLIIRKPVRIWLTMIITLLNQKEIMNVNNDPGAFVVVVNYQHQAWFLYVSSILMERYRSRLIHTIFTTENS